MSRFEKIIVIDDSMMRHVLGALIVILREALGYGTVTWLDLWGGGNREVLLHTPDGCQGLFSAGWVSDRSCAEA